MKRLTRLRRSCFRMALTACASAWLIACAGSARRPVPETAQSVERVSPGSLLADRIETSVRQYSRDGESGVRLLESGLEAFVARATLCRLAERTIDAQYYILNDDLTGRLFQRELLQAADRGVRVRLLLDDVTLKGRDPQLAALEAHPRVELRLFNPFQRTSPRWWQLITRFGEMTRRMHNKTFTADGCVAVLGGRNIGDEYFSANHQFDHADLDAALVGPIVTEVAGSFEKYWQASRAVPLSQLAKKSPSKVEAIGYRQALEETAASETAQGYLTAVGEARLLREMTSRSVHVEWSPVTLEVDPVEKFDGDKDVELMAEALRRRFDAAEEGVMIVSPYFVPTAKGVEWLASMRARGLRVQLLTNSLASTEVAAVHAGYARHRRALIEAGVELYELAAKADREGDKSIEWMGGVETSGLHAKTFIFDREDLFVGSFNLDPRSVSLNSEVGFVATDTPLAAELADLLEQSLNERSYRLLLEAKPGGRGERLVWEIGPEGDRQRFYREPDTALSRRMAAGLLRLVPMDSQL